MIKIHLFTHILHAICMQVRMTHLDADSFLGQNNFFCLGEVLFHFYSLQLKKIILLYLKYKQIMTFKLEEKSHSLRWAELYFNAKCYLLIHISFLLLQCKSLEIKGVVQTYQFFRDGRGFVFIWICRRCSFVAMLRSSLFTLKCNEPSTHQA